MSLNSTSSLTPLSLPLHPPRVAASAQSRPSTSSLSRNNILSSTFTCDLIAPGKKLLRHLSGIAKVCARDVGVRLRLNPQQMPDSAPGGIFTLHLSAGQAISQHAIWCLACRLACFCPDAQVSVLVSAESAFVAASQVPPASPAATMPATSARASGG